MNRHPIGALGGGGWQPNPLPGGNRVSKEKKDQVLSEMFEMFLDVVQTDVIESVVRSCHYNSSKSMEALISISSQDVPADKCVLSTLSGQEAQPNNIFGLDAIALAYENDDDVIVENELEVEIPENVPLVSNCNAQCSTMNSVSYSTSNLKENPQTPQSFHDLEDGDGLSDSMVHAPLSFKSKLLLGKPDCSSAFLCSIDNIEWYIENGMKILILMRGCPGSGKSFLAKQLIDHIGGDIQHHIFSSDNYFIRRGKYLFQSGKLQDAHSWNQKQTLKALESGVSPVIIDNTHTQIWEMDIYVKMAIIHGYAFEILEPQTPWLFNERKLYQKNTHEIPFDKIQLMLSRYEHNITSQILMKRAESSYGLKYENYPPQPAAKPVGKKTKSNSLPDKSEISHSELFKLKTGAIKKGHVSQIQPLKCKPIDLPPSSMTELAQCRITPYVPFNMNDLLKMKEYTMNSGNQKQKFSDNHDTGFSTPYLHTYNDNLPKKFEFTSLKEDVEKKESISAGISNVDISAAPTVEIYKRKNSNSAVPNTVNMIKHPEIEEEIEISSPEVDCAPVLPQSCDIYVSSEDEEISDNEALSAVQNTSLTDNGRFSLKPDIDVGATSLLNFKLCSQSTVRFETNEESLISIANSNQSPMHEEDAFKCDDLLKCEAEEKGKITNFNESIFFSEINNFSGNNLFIDLHEKSEEKEDRDDSSVQSSSMHGSGVEPGFKPAEKDKLTNSSGLSNEVDSSCVSSAHFSETGQSSTRTESDFVCISPPTDSNIVRTPNEYDYDNNLKMDKQSPESSELWIAQGLWNDTKQPNIQNREDNAFQPKPPRSPKARNRIESSESISVMEPVDSSLSDKISWTFCENSAVSWQTIDKNQEEFYGKSQSQELPHTQRAKFDSLETKCDSSDKESMTHHSDFLLLRNPSISCSEHNVKVLSANNRDINSGRNNFERKTFLKLMLDKGTSIDSEFPLSEDRGNQEKLEELSCLFPKVPEAGLMELLEKCHGDVHWVSNLLLDTDNDVFSSTFFQESNNEPVHTDEPLSVEEPQCQTLASGSKPAPAQSEELKEKAMEIKRHLENSIVINSERYSPHLLTIRNIRKASREGTIYKNEQPSQFTSTELNPPHEEPSTLADSNFAHEDISSTHNVYRAKSEEGSDEDENGGEHLELIFGQDFVQQLLDKFGGGDSWNNKKSSPVVKIPVSLARHIHYYLITSQENNEDNESAAMKIQCEEDERMARQLFEEMRETEHQSEPSTPQLQEIMDMQMAEAIYRADLDALQQNSEETMATILAKRLLQDNFPNIDSKILHNMLQAHNNSFEETVKVLRQSLTTDKAVFSANGRELRERELLNQAKRASLSVSGQSTAHVLSSVDDNTLDPGDAIADASAFRRTAALLEDQRKECYLKARDAFQRKERSVAAYYSQLANCHKKDIDHAHARAAASLVEASVASRSRDTMDLHYLRVAEALQVLDLFLDHHITRSDSPGKTSLFIITGRGANSINGKSRIKPAVIRRIKDRKLEYKEENPGLLKVFITRHSSLS